MVKENRWLFVLAFWGYTMGILIYMAFSYQSTKESILEGIDRNLHTAASAIPKILAEDFHDRAYGAGSISAEEDERNIVRLTQYARANGLHFLYTVIKEGEDYYLTTSSRSQEEERLGNYVQYFELYNDASSKLKAALGNRERGVDEYEDRWGSFRTIFIPQVSPGGRVYLACAEVDVAYVKKALSHQLYRVFGEGGFLILIALWVFRIFHGESDRQNKIIKNLIDTTDDLIFYKGVDGRYLGANKAFCDFFGKESMEGLSDADILDAEQLRLTQKSDEEVVRFRKNIRLEYGGGHPLRGRFFFSITKSPILLRGKVVGILGIARDFTREKLLEENRLELNRHLESRVQEEIRKNLENEQMLIQQSKMAAMGEMVGNIAHQWRQPLNVLGMILYQLKEESNEGKLTQSSVEGVYQESRRIIQLMSKTIDDFRDFFRPQRQRKRRSIKEMVTSTIRILDASLAYHGIECKVEIPPHLEISCVEGDFTQVILNLIGNARDAIQSNRPPQKIIHIQGYESEGAICLEVSDSGGGIPLEVAKRVFEPYFTTKKEGTGVGLYMSQVILKKHLQGEIELVDPECAKFRLKFFPSKEA
ncbi:sensor histidine kinase [Wolinella succinogenes]|uniref:sensor histidine kinase n=1 Tax=Wolinella succinogenes TaxID=844 RepID=UPI0016B2B50D|nr:PAS domain-containing sensor histidine kinase [Wolinella succinogenes]NLU35166.1 PAS domain-containing protein [Wolinella succinogenes]